MRTLRGRLTAALVAVVTVGLVALAVITYVEQRSFLLHRVDAQAQSAVTTVGGAGGDGGHGHDGEVGGGGGDLPLGTYGEHRDASGAIISGEFLGKNVLSATDLAAPTLPANPRVGGFETIDSGGVPYRVYAARAADDGDVTVVAVPLSDVEANLSRLRLVEALVVAAVLAVIAFVALAIVRIGLRPLERIGDTAKAIAAGDLAQRARDTDPRSETGRLGEAFNGMLDQLEVAFQRREASESQLRQFLADASHELRTPLTSIRAHSELYRIGATREPADVDRAMQRIEHESTRMATLVEGLLALAQLDELAEPRDDEVDVALLARDAVDDAGAVAREREITLDATDGAVVRGDPDQLRQVLANLLRNAIVHTPAGTQIEVGVRHDGERVTLVVRDHGPGLPPGAGGRIFERFWRTEGGRAQGKAGAGLGLAIVDGIVSAHDGRVLAANADGGGAAFTVELPRRGTLDSQPIFREL